MKTALFIQSYQAATEMVKRHWGFYKNSGLDTYGIGRQNSLCKWPEPIHTKDIGPDGHMETGELPERLIGIFSWFLQDPLFESYSHAMVIEPDSVFFRPPPIQEVTCSAWLAGGPMEGFMSKRFHHNPWWLDRIRAEQFIKEGKRLLGLGIRERGSPDVFFSLVFDWLGVPINHLNGVFSRNGLDRMEDAIKARDLFRSGELWFLHGVKTKEQLDFVIQ